MTIKTEEAKLITFDDIINKFIKNILFNNDFDIFFKCIEERDRKIEHFLEDGKSSLVPKNQLVVLKKWNSYTPNLPQEGKIINKGGGYFINYEDYGIVIDPGYNFIDNFFMAGFKLDDINSIFVTHAHDDHTVQLEAIFSLLYKKNKKKKNRPDDKNFKKIDLFLNLGTFKKFAGILDLSEPSNEFYINRITILNEYHYIKVNNDINVLVTKAKHHEMVTRDYAVGLTFSFESGTDKKIIKFTGDTAWDTNIETKNQQACELYQFDTTDILICNIGTIKKSELSYNTKIKFEENEKNENIFHKNHLGFLGTLAQICFWKPVVTLISEFGLELNEIRTNLAECISREINKIVFPVDINFRIELDEFKVRCFKDKVYYPCDKIKYKKKNDGSIVFFNDNNFSSLEKSDLDLTVNNINIFDE